MVTTLETSQSHTRKMASRIYSLLDMHWGCDQDIRKYPYKLCYILKILSL